MIKEVIVVEGRDDVLAVKRAAEVECIAVGGFGINGKVIARIAEAQKRKGVIVLTDPDFAGEKIRRIIAKRVPGIKHAYITQDQCLKAGDIGVENAEPEAILKALESARCTLEEKRSVFDMQDLMYLGLSGTPKATERRERVGKALGIGFCNSRQFIARLNNYGITKEELLEATRRLSEENKGE